MKSLDCYDVNDVNGSFFAIVCYAVKYFNVQKKNPIDFWSKIFNLKEEHVDWKPASLLMEMQHFPMPYLNNFFSLLFETD